MSLDSEQMDEIIKTDPFGELSWKERKWLLLMGIVSISIAAIFWLLVASVLYFLVIFALPGILDKLKQWFL